MEPNEETVCNPLRQREGNDAVWTRINQLQHRASGIGRKHLRNAVSHPIRSDFCYQCALEGVSISGESSWPHLRVTYIVGASQLLNHTSATPTRLIYICDFCAHLLGASERPLRFFWDAYAHDNAATGHYTNRHLMQKEEGQVSGRWKGGGVSASGRRGRAEGSGGRGVEDQGKGAKGTI
jgi:hypothetical protein